MRRAEGARVLVSRPRNSMCFVAIKMDRLEKQPTDLRQNTCYFGDGTLHVMNLGWMLCASLLLAASAPAGERTALQSSPGTQTNNGGTPTWSFDLDSDYTLGSSIQKYSSFGPQAGYHYEIEVLRDFPLFDKYSLQLGLDSERFAFSRSNSLFPYAMTSVAAEIAVSYWDGDEFFPLLKIEPGFFYTRDYITENSFDIPIRVAFGFKVYKEVHLVLGFSADRFQQIPIFPVAGFNWEINDKLNLRAVFPEPRFSYTPNDSVEFFLAGQYAGGTYRNGPTNDTRTNEALLEYTEIRTGTGISYTLKKGISIEATAGWTFQREFNYFRIGPDIKTRGSPYIRLETTIHFF